MKLQQEGVGIKMDSVLPHLVLVDDDLLSTGIVVYHLKVLLNYVISLTNSYILLTISFIHSFIHSVFHLFGCSLVSFATAFSHTGSPILKAAAMEAVRSFIHLHADASIQVLSFIDINLPNF